MTEKEIVEKVMQETAKTDRNSVNLRRTLDKLSSEIYANADRFIYELLQNACDAAPKNAEVAVTMTLGEDGVLSFCHDGVPFSPENVESLCSVGDSTKADQVERIGYKGIGFKSVFGHSSQVFIRSGDYSFRFDREHWGEKLVPWQVAPIWTDEEALPGPKVDPGMTTIVLSLASGADVAKYLVQMTEHPEFVLFLSSLRSLRVETAGANRTVSKHLDDGVFEIRVDGAPLCRYLVREYRRKVSDEVKWELQRDDRIPDKMKEISVVPISLAFPMNADNRPGTARQPLYAFFPLNDEIGLQLLVNSLFYTTASREAIPQDHPLNKFIICETASCLTQWLAEMALNPQHRSTMLAAVPDGGTSSPLAKDFDKALRDAFASTPCLPDSTGSECILLGEGIRDSAGLLAAIGQDSYVMGDGICRRRVHSSLEAIDRLERFGLKKVGIGDLPDIVSKFGGSLADAETNLALALQLRRHGKGMETVKKTAWLLSSDGRLLPPEALFWPSEGPNAADSLPEELPQVHPLFVREAGGDPAFKTWLTTTVGVAHVQPDAIVRNFLLPRLKGDGVAQSQCSSWIRIAFHAHLAKSLTASDYEQLGRLRVNTRNGASLPARDCWLGVPYDTDQGWESLAGGQPIFDFVADEYLGYGGSRENWVSFFQHMHVPVIQDCVNIRLLGALRGGKPLPEVRVEFWAAAAFKAHCGGRIAEAGYGVLAELPLKTKRGELKPARLCWLGRPYDRENDWEELLGDRKDFNFVGDGYLRFEGSPEEWGYFFRKVGVSDDIRFNAIGNKSRKVLSESYPNYLKFLEAEVSISPANMANPSRHWIEELRQPNVQLSALEDEKVRCLLAERLIRKSISSPSLLQVKYHAHINYYTVPSLIRFLLKKRAMWPGSDQKCHLASELIIESPENAALAGDDLPTINPEVYGVSAKVLADYGCKRALDTEQCLGLLDRIAERGEVSAPTKARISRIYRRLETIRTSPPGLDMKAVEEWAAKAAILSTADTFCSPSALHIANDAELLLVFERQECAFAGDLAVDEAFRLLVTLGANPADASQIEVETRDEAVAAELYGMMHERRHLLALLGAGQHATLEAMAETGVVSFIEALECFRVGGYVLHQVGSSRSKAGSKLSFVIAGTKKLYCMGKEKDPLVVYAVAQELARVLGMPKHAHDIDLLLRLPAQAGKDFLAGQGFDVSVLPAPETKKDAGVPELKPPPLELAPPPNHTVEMDRAEPAVYLPELRKVCCEDRYCATQTPDITRDFAAKLLAKLGEQKSPWGGYLYHFTHVENLLSILKNRAIRSRHRADKFMDSAGESLIAHTSDTVKGFARFYFRPLTPTQWHNECLGRSYGNIRALCPVPIFIRLPLAEVLTKVGSRCAVSNGNMAARSSHFGNHPDFLAHFDAANVYARYGEISTQGFLAASQQEFLVEGELGLADLPVTLICRNRQDFVTLSYLMDLYGVRDFCQPGRHACGNEIIIDPNFYEGDNPSLEVSIGQGRVAAQLAQTANGNYAKGTFRLKAKPLDSQGAPQEVTSSTVVSPEGNKQLEVSFDRRLGLCWTADAEVTIHYEEANTQWLVYGGIVKGAHSRA